MSTQITRDQIVRVLTRLDHLAHMGRLDLDNEDVIDALELFARLGEQGDHPLHCLHSLETTITGDATGVWKHGATHAPLHILNLLDILAPRRCFVTGEVQSHADQIQAIEDAFHAKRATPEPSPFPSSEEWAEAAKHLVLCWERHLLDDDAREALQDLHARHLGAL